MIIYLNKQSLGASVCDHLLKHQQTNCWGEATKHGQCLGNAQNHLHDYAWRILWTAKLLGNFWPPNNPSIRRHHCATVQLTSLGWTWCYSHFNPFSIHPKKWGVPPCLETLDLVFLNHESFWARPVLVEADSPQKPSTNANHRKKTCSTYCIQERKLVICRRILSHTTFTHAWITTCVHNNLGNCIYWSKQFITTDDFLFWSMNLSAKFLLDIRFGDQHTGCSRSDGSCLLAPRVPM